MTSEKPKTGWRSWRARCRKKWNEMVFANKFIVIFTGITAASTLIYAIVTGLQLTALIESNEINRQSLQSVQRAFMSFQAINQIINVERDKSGETLGFEFSASTMNTGNTPSNVYAQYVAAADHEPSQDEFVAGAYPSRVVGPKAIHTFGQIPVSYSEWGLDKIKTMADLQTASKSPKFFVWGWLSYRDIFPGTKLHVTEFCQQLYELGANTMLGPKDRPQWKATFIDCPGSRHNCADEECKDYGDFVSGKVGKPR